jgi:hypothetical protein
LWTQEAGALQNFRPLPPHIPSEVANGMWVLLPIAKNQTNFVFFAFEFVCLLVSSPLPPPLRH